MAETKAKAKATGKEQVLFCKHSERSPERVLASFPPDCDPVHIDARKMEYIAQARAEGRDVNALQFRVGESE